jgi:hypothetical protein
VAVLHEIADGVRNDDPAGAGATSASRGDRHALGQFELVRRTRLQWELVDAERNVAASVASARGEESPRLTMDPTASPQLDRGDPEYTNGGNVAPNRPAAEGIGPARTNPRPMEDSRPTVQRTLVKSPPELWAELSNPESLARRLGEFGEIRITRLVPEKTVAWEGERASGTVEIEPSGWGTKVRLSAKATAPAIEGEMVTEEDLERESALAAAVKAEIEREAAIEAALLAEVQREAEIEAALRAQAEAEADAEGARQRAAAAQADRERRAAAEAETARLAAAGEPARGFFSRFRKRRKTDPTPATPVSRIAAGPTSGASTLSNPSAGSAAPSAGAAPRAHATPTPVRQPARPAAPGHRPPVRLAALAFAPAHQTDRPLPVTTTTAEFDKPGAETITASRHPRSKIPAKPALDDEQTLAVLAGVLDDLGAAHHRPFSRD